MCVSLRLLPWLHLRSGGIYCAADFYLLVCSPSLFSLQVDLSLLAIKASRTSARVVPPDTVDLSIQQDRGRYTQLVSPTATERCYLLKHFPLSREREGAIAGTNREIRFSIGFSRDQ
jgi:hypothetical protein